MRVSLQPHRRIRVAEQLRFFVVTGGPLRNFSQVNRGTGPVPAPRSGYGTVMTTSGEGVATPQGLYDLTRT